MGQIKILSSLTHKTTLPTPYRKIFFVYQKALIQTFHTSFSLKNNLCEFTIRKHKFNRWFCTEKPVLNVHSNDFWYTKINLSQNYIFFIQFISKIFEFKRIWYFDFIWRDFKYSWRIIYFSLAALILAFQVTTYIQTRPTHITIWCTFKTKHTWTLLHI